MQIAISILEESWSVLGQMAPYLLFGFLAAGVLSIWISPEFVERHLGGRGFKPVLKAAILGVPLPLCSCGVIPVGASLRRHGASRAATTSFLLSTPQTGVDSILITYALLGLLFAVYRPVIALATGLLGGLLVMLVAQNGKQEATDAHEHGECTDACCKGDRSRGRLRRMLEHGFVTLPRDVGLPLLIGVVIAGAITALVPQPNELRPYLGGGILSILLMMAVGVPLYVCASASVPIAAGLIHLGASPGAALAFLIAGPATNAATIATIWKLLGKRSAALYVFTIAISAVGGGLLLDWLMPAAHAAVPPLAPTGHHVHGEMGPMWLSTFWAIVLLGVLAFSYMKRPAAERSSGEPAAENLELAIAGMTCQHCVAAVRRALTACRGVTAVEVDLARGRAMVFGDDLDRGQLVAAVATVGFRAESAAEHACGS
ncbi:MAG: SO_0444 family Cu/Zn efflux transporter [Thermoguttaceae bacterium]